MASRNPGGKSAARCCRKIVTAMAQGSNHHLDRDLRETKRARRPYLGPSQAGRRISLYRLAANEERQAPPRAAFGPSGLRIQVAIVESVRESDRTKLTPPHRDGPRHHPRIPRRGQRKGISRFTLARPPT